MMNGCLKTPFFAVSEVPVIEEQVVRQSSWGREGGSHGRFGPRRKVQDNLVVVVVVVVVLLLLRAKKILHRRIDRNGKRRKIQWL
jgi:hypothetical protein